MKALTDGDGWRELSRHWLKFNAVGAIGIGVQLATLAVLAEGLGLNYLWATALAVEAAVLHNFVWHERWTWVERTTASHAKVIHRLIRFHLTTGAVSLLGNLVLMGLLVGRLHVHYFLANVLTIAICSLLNFLASDRLVFQPSVVEIRKPEGEADRVG